jgi:hypothetical protein
MRQLMDGKSQAVERTHCMLADKDLLLPYSDAACVGDERAGRQKPAYLGAAS